MALENVGYAAARKRAVGDRAGPWDLAFPIAIAAAPALGLLLLVPTRLVPPVLSLLSLVMACGLALYAAMTKSRRGVQSVEIRDLSCAFAFVWIVTAKMSNPQHVLDWFDRLSMTLP